MTLYLLDEEQVKRGVTLSVLCNIITQKIKNILRSASNCNILSTLIIVDYLSVANCFSTNNISSLY